MAHELLGSPVDVYLKKGKSVLSVSTSPSSVGTVVAVLSECSSDKDDNSSALFELSLYIQLESLTSVGSYSFKLPSVSAFKVKSSQLTWHASGNLILIMLNGNLLLFSLKWLDKKHFNEEITFKETVLRCIQLNSDDSLIGELIAVNISLQTNLKKLSEKISSDSEHSVEYVNSVTPLRDGHSLLVGTSKGLYRVINSWKESSNLTLSLYDSITTSNTATSSEDSVEIKASTKCAYKGFQSHVLSRIWEPSQRGIILNSAMNHDESLSLSVDEAPLSPTTAVSTSASTGDNNSNTAPVEYRYSHISVEEVQCFPIKQGVLNSDLNNTSFVVAIQSDGSLTISCLSGGDISPGGSLPVMVSGHVHPVLLTGYPLPKTLKAAKGMLYPCVYQKVCNTSVDFVSAAMSKNKPTSFKCSQYVTEYDALVKAQSDIDEGQGGAGVGAVLNSPHKKVAINGHCEEEISTVLAVLLSEHTVPSTSGSQVNAVSASCILTALVNTKHMPLAVRDLPVSSTGGHNKSKAGSVVDDRMESQSLVQWVVSVSVAPTNNIQSTVDFSCLQSVFLASQPCTRTTESLQSTYTLSSVGHRLVAVSLNGLITLRSFHHLQVVTHSFDCRLQEFSKVSCALGRLHLFHSIESSNHLISTKIQTIPLLNPVEVLAKTRFPSQQSGIFFDINSSFLYLLNNHVITQQSVRGQPYQSLSTSETLLKESEESLQYDRIKVPRNLKEDVLIAQMILKNGKTGEFTNTAGLIVASTDQIRTTFITSTQHSVEELPTQTGNYIALIPGGSIPSPSTSKYVSNCSVLYLFNRRTNKWRTTLLSIPSTNTQKDLTMGSNAGAQVGKFSKARLIVQIPHISEVLDGHVNAELAAVASRSKTLDVNDGLRMGHLKVDSGTAGGLLLPESDSRLRSNSFTSITSITSSAVSMSHKVFLNKSRLLTNKTNTSIYNQITTTISMAVHSSHTIILLTQRKSRYFLEIVSRDACKESLSSGKPQPNVHHLIALPPGFSPLGMTTQDIVRLNGGTAVPPSSLIVSSVSMDRDLSASAKRNSGVTFTEQSGDLDTAGSSHSSAVNQHVGERFKQVIGERSCAVVVFSADGTFVSYCVTAVMSDAEAATTTAGGKTSSVPSSTVSTLDFKVMELFTINVKQFMPSEAGTKIALEPSALRKIIILPLNAPLFDKQKERHQLFTTLSLPYICLVLLTSSGSVYVGDAYAKSLTVVPSPHKVMDMTSLSASHVLGVANISDSVDKSQDVCSKVDVIYNDMLLLQGHPEEFHPSGAGASSSTNTVRHLWMSYSHTHQDDNKKTNDDDFSTQILSHNETDELFFANLHLNVPSTPKVGGDASVQLVSVMIPLTDSTKPFTALPVHCGELFSVFQQSPSDSSDIEMGKFIGHRESLLMSLLKSLVHCQTKRNCIHISSSSCPCCSNNASAPVSVFSALDVSSLVVPLTMTLQIAIHNIKKNSSRFSFFLSALENHMRSVISLKRKKLSSTATECPSAYQQLTCCLHTIDAIMMLEIVTRLSRRLEPSVSKLLFPLYLTIGKSEVSRELVVNSLEVTELFELCLADHLLHYCNRLLSVACENFGGSESHLTTVISLILSLEHLHLAYNSDNMQLVCECLEFCNRLEELLVLHSGEFVQIPPANVDEHQKGRSMSVPGRRRRSLSDSYVETVVQNALSQIRRKRNKVIPRVESSLVSSSSATSGPAAPQQGYYLGYGVVWLLTTTANLFLPDTPPPSSSSTFTSEATKKTATSQLKRSRELSASLRLDAYKYTAIDLLTQKLGPHVVNGILCGFPVHSEPSEGVDQHSIGPSITMCLLIENIRLQLSTSKHYASAAILISALLRHRTSLDWLDVHFTKLFKCNQSSESVALGADAKVRRILYILRLNKILSHGTKTATYIALFNAEPPTLNGKATLSSGSVSGYQGIAYSAQYLRRITEGEKIHTQGHSKDAANSFYHKDFSSSFYISTPRANTDRLPFSPTAGAAAVTAALTSPAAADNVISNKWIGESSYFELPEDLLEKRRALRAIDMLKSLVVGLLLCGEEHAVYLMFKIILPFMMMSEGCTSESADVDLVLRELFVAKSLTAIEGDVNIAPAFVEENTSEARVYYEVRDRASVIKIFRLMISEEGSE